MPRVKQLENLAQVWIWHYSPDHIEDGLLETVVSLDWLPD